MFDLQIRTGNKAALNDQFGNNMFDLQIRTGNKTALNDLFGNNVFHLQIRTGNKTVLIYQFGNIVFHLEMELTSAIQFANHAPSVHVLPNCSRVPPNFEWF